MAPVSAGGARSDTGRLSSHASSSARSQATRDFFKWAFEHGQAQATELHYVPLPAELVQQIDAYWSAEFK